MSEPTAPPGEGVTTAILGSWGYYGLLEDARAHPVETPYGAPSDDVVIGTAHGRRIAYLNRSGRDRTIPPHRTNHRANIWALHHLGVRKVLAATPAGAFDAAVGVGTVMVPDQLVDRTGCTDDTFHDDEDVRVSFAQPFSEAVRSAAVDALREQRWVVGDGGVVVAIRGPRFSTAAESRWYAAQGWDLVSTTPYPEAVLARELGMDYACVALITDHDVIAETPWPVSQDRVAAELDANTLRLREGLVRAAAALS